MMRPATLFGCFCLCLALAGPAIAQGQASPKDTPPAAGDTKQVSVDLERLAAARALVTASQGDRDEVLDAMRVPMTAMMQQMGLKDPEKARVMVQEVIMPILSAHYDELLSIQALAFAAVLSKEDLAAIVAFYATPAGKNLVKAKPQLTQATLTGMQKWLGALAPEIQDKAKQSAEAHGWVPGKPDGKPKPN